MAHSLDSHSSHIDFHEIVNVMVCMTLGTLLQVLHTSQFKTLGLHFPEQELKLDNAGMTN